MKNAVLVGMVVLLAVMVAAPVMARSEPLYDGNGNVIGVTDDGGRALHDRYGNRISAYEYANGYPEGCGQRGGNSGYGGRQGNYGSSSGRRGGGNSNRTSFNVGVGARIGGVGINLGYSKTTNNSKPKAKPYVYRPQVVRYQSAPTVVVVPTPKPTPTKCRMTLVQKIGDGLETISDIVVTNPDKELSPGKHIVFERNGQFFAEYVVDKVSGVSVFVETVEAPRGNPRQGDSFKIEDPPKDINVVE